MTFYIRTRKINPGIVGYISLFFDSRLFILNQMSSIIIYIYSLQWIYFSNYCHLLHNQAFFIDIVLTGRMCSLWSELMRKHPKQQKYEKKKDICTRRDNGTPDSHRSSSGRGFCTTDPKIYQLYHSRVSISHGYCVDTTERMDG